MKPEDRLSLRFAALADPVRGGSSRDSRKAGGRTELVPHLIGYDGRPGGFAYDGRDAALSNLGRHLGGEPHA